MKSTVILFALLFAAVYSSVVAQDEPAAPLTVAVLDFQVDEKLASKGSEAAVLLNAQLSASPNLILVERQELEKLLGEQELGLSGTVDPATAAKVGALTGAKVLVTGRMFDAGGKFYLVAKIIGTETSRVFGEAVPFGDLAAMDKAVEELGPKIALVIENRRDSLIAKVEAPGVRMERLKALIGEGKLPLSVSVQISEEHIGRAIPDPAAQTEMIHALQELGFTILDPTGSAAKPDIAIVGEAFSEFGARRGNLVSCRSRVELKVTDMRTGKLFLVDRQTDVAVDLAENIAAKKALENAALKLLDRLVPAIVKE